MDMDRLAKSTLGEGELGLIKVQSVKRSFNRADDILALLHPFAQKSGKCRQPPGGTNPGG